MNIFKVAYENFKTQYDASHGINTTNQGMTKEQLSVFKQMLLSQGARQTTQIDSVITNYDNVDTNHDGKVTMAEIYNYLKKKGLVNQNQIFSLQGTPASNAVNPARQSMLKSLNEASQKTDSMTTFYDETLDSSGTDDLSI
jgi:hypothetical protein